VILRCQCASMALVPHERATGSGTDGGVLGASGLPRGGCASRVRTPVCWQSLSAAARPRARAAWELKSEFTTRATQLPVEGPKFTPACGPCASAPLRLQCIGVHRHEGRPLRGVCAPLRGVCAPLRPALGFGCSAGPAAAVLCAPADRGYCWYYLLTALARAAALAEQADPLLVDRAEVADHDLPSIRCGPPGLTSPIAPGGAVRRIHGGCAAPRRVAGSRQAPQRCSAGAGRRTAERSGRSIEGCGVGASARVLGGTVSTPS
jgi:hypothetical protein